MWEGRHKASLVDADDYLLISYRYIELNPVAAGMVGTPEQYRWSSYGWHAWGKPDRWIQDHPLYDALDRNPQMRRFAYRELCRHQLPEHDVHTIRECLAYNYPLGNDRFRTRIEAALGRAVGEQRRGRPPRGREASG